MKTFKFTLQNRFDLTVKRIRVFGNSYREVKRLIASEYPEWEVIAKKASAPV